MNKQAKAREITLGGAIILIVMGIVFLSQSASDSTGVVFWLGIVFLFVGIISLIAILISYFKR
jgi:uncharacterized membrane protein HdeD (DUF308 family)